MCTASARETGTPGPTNTTDGELLPLLLVPERSAAAGERPPPLERALLPAQRLGVASVDPVVTLSFPPELLRRCRKTETEDT